jgi:hypothetical protein
MSGFGSGRWFRSGTRVPVETCFVLDVNVLLLQGALRPGVCSAQRWSIVGVDDATSGASVRTCASVNALTLSYTVTEGCYRMQNYSYKVRLKWIPCNFGGKRPYFVCPNVVNKLACRRRVEKPYLPPGEDLFLCRRCYRLTFYSCNESGDVHFTAMRHTKRAARKLELTNPMDVYSMDRPKGMHKKTFERLRTDVVDTIEREQSAFGVVMRKSARSIG